MEHITPEAQGGTSDEENLWLSCRNCNEFKGIQTHARDMLTGRWVPLFHPRRQKWSQHFVWSEDGTRAILARTDSADSRFADGTYMLDLAFYLDIGTEAPVLLRGKSSAPETGAFQFVLA